MNLAPPQEAGSRRACGAERRPPSAASDGTRAPSSDVERERTSSSMNLEAQADVGAGFRANRITPLERESVEVSANAVWSRQWDPEGSDEDDIEDDLEEGDHALCVPEELEGRLGLHSLPLTSAIQWSGQEEEDAGPGARLQEAGPSQGRGREAQPDSLDAAALHSTVPPPRLPQLGGAGMVARGASGSSLTGNAADPDPLHNVLNWMELANVDEASPLAQPAQSSQCPRGRGRGAAPRAGAPGLLGGVHGISCLGENARRGSSELSFGSDGDESYPDVPSEVQDENEQSCLGVPSDEESRPRPPPYAAHIALMRWSDTNKLAASKDDEDLPTLPAPRPAATTGMSSALPSQCAPRSSSPGVVDREEDEWMARKKLTGAIGRLVSYRDGQIPAEDILGLSRTRYGRIKVTALRQNGVASSAGVEVGDQLISIDGQRPSDHRLAESIRTSLRAPSTLIFMGFAGKLQAEVRVRQPDEPRCGLPHFADVATAALDRRAGGQGHVELCDAVVFQQPATSLLLEVDAGPPASTPQHTPRQPTLPLSATPPVATMPYSMPPPQLFASEPDASPAAPQAAESQQTPRGEEGMSARASSRVYELQREEAKRLVRRALRERAAIGV